MLLTLLQPLEVVTIVLQQAGKAHWVPALACQPAALGQTLDFSGTGTASADE
jgi:hypothetical protein